VISNAQTIPQAAPRKWPRYSNLKDLCLIYEGRSEVFSIRPPDISPTGMFINTTADFPEGAILKVSFRLAKSNYPITVRCEVRYCLSGVGIGIEFIDMPSADQEAIAKETRTPSLTFKLRAISPTKKQRATDAKNQSARRKKR
jgi:hypothetical protein